MLPMLPLSPSMSIAPVMVSHFDPAVVQIAQSSLQIKDDTDVVDACP